jgi:glyoxylase-like metal-dependent hydrolase (beta-lactamase superfamily II)
VRLAAAAPGVLVATSRRDHTTSTVVVPPGSGAPVLLVDPSWEPDELAGLGADLAVLGHGVTAGLATHAHHDHLLWHPSFGSAPRYASPETARRAKVLRDELMAGLGPGWPKPLLELFGSVTAVEGAVLPWEGPSVELIVHDGHIPGHTAAWIPSMGVLVAGDMLSDVELPLPHDAGEQDPIEAYVAGLERLAPYVGRAALVVPGHGSPTSDGRARLDADLRYLEDIIEGRAPADSRLADPGMADAHARTLRLVRP